MVNIETIDTATIQRAKKRAPKSKPIAMNGSVGDYREGHDLQELSMLHEHVTMDDLYAKRLSKEMEAARIHEVRIVLLFPLYAGCGVAIQRYVAKVVTNHPTSANSNIEKLEVAVPTHCQMRLRISLAAALCAEPS